jgi:hypothetical protein
VKRKFLEFVKEYVLKLKKELVLSLPGFLLCMLPALEDQNSDLLKKVEHILAETEKIVGTSKFFGEIWKAMLRTPRARLSAIKFLVRKVPKDRSAAASMAREGKIHTSPYNLVIRNGTLIVEDYNSNSGLTPAWVEQELILLNALENSQDKNAFFYFYFPNKENLVINALLSGLDIIDQTVYVNRATFDFLISHVSLITDINTHEENVRLVEGALLTLKKRDFASLKKFFVWFQGHLEDHETKPSKDDPAIRVAIPALQRLFKRFKHVKTVARSGFQTKVTASQQYDIFTPI